MIFIEYPCALDAFPIRNSNLPIGAIGKQGRTTSNYAVILADDSTLVIICIFKIANIVVVCSRFDTPIFIIRIKQNIAVHIGDRGYKIVGITQHNFATGIVRDFFYFPITSLGQIDVFTGYGIGKCNGRIGMANCYRDLVPVFDPD